MIDILLGIWLSSGLGYKDPSVYGGLVYKNTYTYTEVSGHLARKIETGDGFLLKGSAEYRFTPILSAGIDVSYAVTSEWQKVQLRGILSYRNGTVEVSGLVGKDDLGARGRIWFHKHIGVDAGYLRFKGRNGFRFGVVGRL